MSEEEILNIIENEYLLKTDFRIKNKIVFDENLLNKALWGLLDLYNKEKEKNRALEHLLELKRKRIKKLSELIEECGDDE